MNRHDIKMARVEEAVQAIFAATATAELFQDFVQDLPRRVLLILEYKDALQALEVEEGAPWIDTHPEWQTPLVELMQQIPESIH